MCWGTDWFNRPSCDSCAVFSVYTPVHGSSFPTQIIWLTLYLAQWRSHWQSAYLGCKHSEQESISSNQCCSVAWEGPHALTVQWKIMVYWTGIWWSNCTLCSQLCRHVWCSLSSCMFTLWPWRTPLKQWLRVNMRNWSARWYSAELRSLSTTKVESGKQVNKTCLRWKD